MSMNFFTVDTEIGGADKGPRSHHVKAGPFDSLERVHPSPDALVL